MCLIKMPYALGQDIDQGWCGTGKILQKNHSCTCAWTKTAFVCSNEFPDDVDDRNSLCSMDGKLQGQVLPNYIGGCDGNGLDKHITCSTDQGNTSLYKWSKNNATGLRCPGTNDFDHCDMAVIGKWVSSGTVNADKPISVSYGVTHSNTVTRSHADTVSAAFTETMGTKGVVDESSSITVGFSSTWTDTVAKQLTTMTQSTVDFQVPCTNKDNCDIYSEGGTLWLWELHYKDKNMKTTCPSFKYRMKPNLISTITASQDDPPCCPPETVCQTQGHTKCRTGDPLPGLSSCVKPPDFIPERNKKTCFAPE